MDPTGRTITAKLIIFTRIFHYSGTGRLLHGKYNTPKVFPTNFPLHEDFARKCERTALLYRVACPVSWGNNPIREVNPGILCL
ncbi:MAG: hypothetical protein D3917_00375 [Candidatus Electrothrix sp. AX5]|nr:hypothetical protein [Candidatus Electrothrix sp. AX5]